MIPFNNLLRLMQQQGYQGSKDFRPIPFEGGMPAQPKGYFPPIPFEGGPGFGSPKGAIPPMPFEGGYSPWYRPKKGAVPLNNMMQMPWFGMGIR